MTPTRLPRLGVESVEDRLLPSPMFARPPAWAEARVADADDDDDSSGEHRGRGEQSAGPRGHAVSFEDRADRHGEFRGHAVSFETRDGPDRRAPAPRVESVGAIIVILPPVRVPAGGFILRFQAAADDPPAPAEPVTIRETPPAAPAAVRADDPGSREPAAAPAATASLAAPVDSSDAATAPAANPAVAVVRPAADAPASVPPGPPAAPRQDFVFLGTAVSAADESVTPPADDATTPSVTVEVAPSPVPALVERVIDAILPADAPLAGLLPIDVTAVQAGAAALFASLPDVGLTDGDDWSSPERWAWLTGAVLVVGGTTYAARGHRGRRRADPAPLGTASALARWEGRHAADRPD